MIVFLLDLAMVSVVILLAYVLHVSQWVLTDLRPDGSGASADLRTRRSGGRASGAGTTLSWWTAACCR